MSDLEEAKKRKSEDLLLESLIDLVCQICSWSLRCGTSPQLQLSTEEK